MKVLLFAKLRDITGHSHCELAVDTPTKISSLRAKLQQVFPDQADYFTANSALVAVNQTICHQDIEVSALDEVAFFPPVTGG